MVEYESRLGESRSSVWNHTDCVSDTASDSGGVVMWEMIKNWWNGSQDYKIDGYFGKLDHAMQEILNKCDSIERQLDAEVKMLTEEVALYKGILHSVSETVPDMMWCKDLDGKYVYANLAIKTGLLFDNAKRLFGNDNHTFGEVCGNSDAVVIEKVQLGVFRKEDGRFLESGKIRGKMVYLEVFKAPWYVNGELRGVVGTGRNMTEYVEAYREHNCNGCNKMVDIFKKYEYGE